jgi:hypothetical protein
MEKHFQGLELNNIPRGENVEADEIAKHASHRLAQPVGVFEECLFKPSALHHQQGQSFLPSCRRHQSRGLRTVGCPQATVFS